jgi:ATP-binding cassette, subfamily B, multidrug efflux pump
MSKVTPLNLWLRFLGKHWKMYSLGVLTVVLTDIMQVLGTLSLGWVLDYFTGDELPQFFNRFEGQAVFWALFWVLVLTRVFLALGRVGWRLTLARKTHVASAYLRREIWDKVRYFSRDDLNEKWTKGVLMNASNSDVNASRFLFGFTLVAVIDVVFLGLFTVWAMLSINVTLTMWALIVLTFLPVVVKRLSDQEMDRYRSAQEALSSFNDLSSQVVSTIRLQRQTQTGNFWERRLLKNAEDYRQIRLKAVFTSLRFIPTMGFGAILSYVVLFALGIPYVLSGTMSIGDFVAMQGLIFLLQAPLMELGFIISEAKKGQTSLLRLAEIYNHPPEEDLFIGEQSAHEVINHREAPVLETRNLTFAFNSNPALFRDLSIKLYQGDRLGVLGPIGSGKSIFIELLAGLRRPTQGEVLLYGEPFSHYTHDSLRKEITIVPQKPFLFADTIKRNLTIDTDVSDEECWRILELAGLRSDVESFPDKLNTQLGEWGINLSGGQKQRLTLARALVRRPKILILDDCLSAVDTVTEEHILSRLNRELSDTTLIWVAHRTSTLKYCQSILELGRVEQEVLV